MVGLLVRNRGFEGQFLTFLTGAGRRGDELGGRDALDVIDGGDGTGDGRL